MDSVLWDRWTNQQPQVKLFKLLCIPQQYPCILWTQSSTLSLGFLLILLHSSDPPCLCGHPSLAAHTAPESTSLFAANLPSSPMWNHTQCCGSCHLMNVILAPPVSSLILTANFSIVDRMTTNFSNNCGFNIKVLELQILRFVIKNQIFPSSA